MSRSKHGSKGPGYDYWSKRPYSSIYGHGKEVKNWTHRAERRQATELIRSQVDEFQPTAPHYQRSTMSHSFSDNVKHVESRVAIEISVATSKHGMFAVWGTIDEQIYCISKWHNGEWDAVAVSDVGQTTGEWSSSLTEMIRQQTQATRER